jgi:hypothetical protein
MEGVSAHNPPMSVKGIFHHLRGLDTRGGFDNFRVADVPFTDFQMRVDADQNRIRRWLRQMQQDLVARQISDESKCQNPDIFPVTTTITDGAGHLEEWEEVDPRPKRIN